MAVSYTHLDVYKRQGLIRVYYKDGTCDKMALRNPDNWAPIEHIFFEVKELGKAVGVQMLTAYVVSLLVNVVGGLFMN